MLLFRVTPLLLVVVQPCMERTLIKKKQQSKTKNKPGLKQTTSLLFKFEVLKCHFSEDKQHNPVIFLDFSLTLQETIGLSQN